MKFKSQVYTQASGSVGGLTYARNSGGMYTRGRGLVTNPNTQAQQVVRGALGALSAGWKALTVVQRDAWTIYAANSPVTNALGDPLILTGQQMYVRCNTPRMTAGYAPITAAPVIFGQTTLSPVSFAVAPGATPDLDITFDNSNVWAIAAAGRLFAQASIPQSPSINFFKGPFFFAGAIEGAVVPPASPFSLAYVDTNNGAAPVAAAAGQKVFVRVVAQAADGRLSAPQVIDAIVT